MKMLRSGDVIRITMGACMRRRLAVLVVGAVLLGFASSALAAGGWEASTMVSSLGEDGRSPVVAVDGRGDAVAAWLDQYGFNWDIDASTHAAGGEWQKPVVISTPGDIGFHPEVAIDSRGDAIAVWRDGNSDQVEAAIHKAGQEWQASVAISTVGDNEKPTVALDSSGEAVVVWERAEGSRHVIQAALGSAESGVWGEPVDLSAPAEAAGNPQVAVDGHGEATVVWQSCSEGDYYIQAATGSSPHGTWGGPVDVSVVGEVAANPRVAVNDAGEAVAVWEWGGVGLTPYVVQGVARAVGGQWDAPASLSSGGASADFPDVAVDARGDAVAVWENYDDSSGGGSVQSAVLATATGVWQAPMDLSVAGENGGSPQVAVDPEGAFLAVWSGERVQGSVFRSDGRWGAPLDIGTGGGVRVAVDEEGNAVTVWEDASGAIQSAGYIAQSEQLGSEESEHSAGGGSEGSERAGSARLGEASEPADASASGEPGGKEAKAPIAASEPRLMSARIRCAAAASARVGKKAFAANHRARRGMRGCAARVMRTAHHGHRGQ